MSCTTGLRWIRRWIGDIYFLFIYTSINMLHNSKTQQQELVINIHTQENQDSSSDMGRRERF